MWEGVSPSHDGDFLGFGGTNWCVIKFKLASIEF